MGMAEDGANSKMQCPSGDQTSNLAVPTIETGVGVGPEESTCNNISGISAENGGEREESLERAEELMALGFKASKERDFSEATEFYSRALEIRVAHFGELAPECVSAYYKFGCALLYKAQEEADPLGSVPKKEGASQDNSNKDGSIKSSHAESCAASISNGGEGDKCSSEDPEKNEDGKGEEGEDESDDEELADGDEDESDLDLSWKMLDVARVIVEKHSGDTMEKVDILSALAEVALEREDIETSLNDYSKALSILERLVEPDSRLIAELNFRICLCLEIGSKAEEAIPYCQKAISVCRSRVQRLKEETKNLPGPAVTESNDTKADKEAEIETLTDLCGDLEKKLEDLQQLVSNPKSIFSDILGIISAKAKAAASSSELGTAGAAGSTTPTAAAENGGCGVTHLGVVGRGVKRVVMSSSVGPTKKPAVGPSSESGDGGST